MSRRRFVHICDHAVGSGSVIGKRICALDSARKGISALSDEALSSPSSLKNALTRLIRRKGLVNRSATEALHAEWTRIVGPEIGRRSRARRIRDGVLEVVVTNSATMEELRGYLHETVLQQIQISLPESKIRSIRYVRAR
ncbi:MAG: DUF721 domain-containing protein [Planctomycetota bacterium]|nr:MAG: DUF721 domain-containing protein [Planctomycetota bacterium]